jgi:PAS domain S-box-containing protein
MTLASGRASLFRRLWPAARAGAPVHRIFLRAGRPTLSLSQHLGVLTLVVALPLIVVSFFMLGRFADSQREGRRAFLLAATHALADAVETKLGKYLVVSNVLSNSRSLREGDLVEFQRTASEVLRTLPETSLVVATPDGKPLFDPVSSTNLKLRLADEPALRERAFATQTAVFSGVDFDPSSRTPIATIETPIFEDGKPLYLLTLVFSLQPFSELLRSQKYPSGWISGIVDDTAHFVARSPEGDARVGSLASQSFRNQMQGPAESTSNNISLEGQPVVSAYRRIDYGWTVGVAVKQELLDETLSRALLALGLLAAGSLAMSFALSYFANRRLAFGVRFLQRAAKDIGEGKRVLLKRTGVREFDELSLAFAQASSLLRERAIQRQVAEAGQSASEERFRILADSLPQLVWTAGPDGRVDYTNARREKYGKAGLRRTDWDGVIHPQDLRSTVAAWLKASEAGEPYEKEHRLMVAGQGYCWHLSRAIPLKDAEGQPVKWYGTTTDIHDHKMREEHIRVLMREVNHRSKNLLAVTQAIARQTVSSSATAADFEQKFSARLLGLAASQDLLTEEKWRGVQLEALVLSQLDHYSERGGGRFLVAGPTIALNSVATQAIGMALHELATNAVKYGALANDKGQIEVKWRIEERGAESTLEIDWIERRGPPVAAPSTRGFGSVVIEKMVAQRLNGTVRLSFEVEGVSWRLSVPLKNVIATDDLEERADFARGR